MTVLITLTTYGSDTGPFFDLYSDVDGYVTAFETGVAKAALIAGYTSTLVPDFATVLRIQSTGACDNYVDVDVIPATTSTSSTTTTSTTAVLYNTFNARLSATEVDHCSEAAVAVYVAQGETIMTATTVYSNASLTSTVSGNYISEENAGVIYNIAVGVVGSATGDLC